MVVGTFPIAKLGVLLVKQISKPIANMVKERAKTHPFFRTYVCLPPAYFYNWCEVKSKMWVLNIGRSGKLNIPVLSETMAIELEVNLLGEGIIFALGAALLIFEYNRQSNKEIAKESARKEEMDNLTSTIRDLFFVVQTQQTQVRELQRSVGELETRGIWQRKSKKTEPPAGSPPEGSPPEGNDFTMPELREKISKLQPKINFDTDDAPTSKYSSRPTLLPLFSVQERKDDIITQSINYVQFDVFKFKSESNEKLEQLPCKEKQTGLISDALVFIQHDLKGLL